MARPAKALARSPGSLLERVIRHYGPQAVALALAKAGPPELVEETLRSDWRLLRRPEQTWPTGEWDFWLCNAGRGWGKTRTGAENVHEAVNVHGYKRIALVADTQADARDVMIAGPAGLLNTAKPWNPCRYVGNARSVLWENGAQATVFSSEAFEALRGPQHDFAWVDELAKMRRAEDTWAQLMFGLRLGNHPRAIVTTTPRPIRLMKELLADPRTVVSAGSTYDNATNLAGIFLRQILKRYEGTRLGRQEIHAEILDDTPGALWRLSQIEATRFRGKVAALRELLVRIVVAVDPAVTYGEESDETGIIVVGVDRMENGYVLEDCTVHDHPSVWGRAVVGAFDRWNADAIVAESNQGGELVRLNIAGAAPRRQLPIRLVNARRGKASRAEPIATLYERGIVHHCGAFPALEDQMCAFVPGQDDASPDRMDALVYGLTELMDATPPENPALDVGFGIRPSPWKGV